MNISKKQVLALLILIAASIITTLGYTVNTLPQSNEEMWVSDTVDSEFDVDQVKITALGKNKMRVKIDYTNGDVGSDHSANVTIALIDASGDIVSIGGVDQIDSALTGVIAADSSDKIKVVFTATGIVSATEDVMLQFSDLT